MKCRRFSSFRSLDAIALHWVVLACLAALFAAITLYRGLVVYERLLREPGAHHGIVSLEPAFTPTRAREILQPWAVATAPDCACGGSCTISDCARASLYRDFLFIPAYVAFLAALFTLLLRLVDLSPASMCRLYLALGLAGLLDTVENIVLSSSLPLMPSWDTTLVAGIAASLKFLLLAGVVAILVAIVVDVCVDHFKS